ncbi:carbohydrate ABC transporter permease [Vacuolonema iberomarrocanum]|uniref:carbohydrate ABC transporter permease n=1 Tax=Vacuolonema iberomarrocanum TaxID=3454632 RepID=UPI0019DCB3EC|nr:sugar ABC transporter permease [filamentous cyanobacterium LEGE 07170]
MQTSKQRGDRSFRKLTLTQQLTPYLFLAPALLILGLTVFYPAVQAFLLSFTRYEFDITQPPIWVGLDNFQRLLGDEVFWETLVNTLLYLVCVVPLLVILPLLLAILVNRALPGIHWFRAAYYTPVIISMVVAGIAWNWLYTENGLFNQFLSWFATGMLNWLPDIDRFAPLVNGLVALREGIPWLTSPDLALFSVMAVTVWKGLGYYMVIYLAGLQSIPKDLYEAAAIDGSDGWQKHWDITIPLMRPYLLLVGVISAIAATKVFEEIFVMTQGGPRNNSKTIVYYVYEEAFENLEISYACTIGLVLFLIILALSILRLTLGGQSKPLV